MNLSSIDKTHAELLALRLLVSALLHDAAARKHDPRAWLAEGLDKCDAALAAYTPRSGDAETDMAIRERAMSAVQILIGGALPTPIQSPGPGKEG